MIPKIRDVRCVATCPAGINLLVVKVETTEPGLYGLGCATFAYRVSSVMDLVETYIKPLLVGREVNRISDIWQLLHQNAYWRSGPIANNAISGVDEALWDIKGKMAGMPIYELLGGKVRDGVTVFTDARGETIEELFDSIDAGMAAGFKHFRCHCGAGGMSTGMDVPANAARGAQPGAYIEPRKLVNSIVDMFEAIRVKYGDEIEIMYDVHERVNPIQARELAKRVEPLHPFFLEDIVSPENTDWLKIIHDASTTPIAHGELVVNPHEWRRPIVERSIDYIRCHLSDIGGLTPGWKVAMLGEQFDVKNCWHNPPGDITPIGSACNLHLDLASASFGIQEWTDGRINASLRQKDSGSYEALHEVFSGWPEYGGDGFVYLSDRPGHGVDMDEAAAAKYPCDFSQTYWTQTRTLDGALHTP